MRSPRLLLVTLVAALCSFFVPAAAQAATFTPTNAAQLVAAITTSNVNDADDVIDLGGNTITLSVANNVGDALPEVLPDNDHQLTITNGTINATASDSRILHLTAGSDVRLVGLTLSGGLAEDADDSAEGGAIRSDTSTLELDGVEIRNSSAVGSGGAARGGAVFAESSILTIANSTFEDNSASTGAAFDLYGGALYLLTTPTTVSTTMFEGNGLTGGDDALGGAIMASSGSPITVARSSFVDNVVTIGSGASISSGGAMYIATSATVSRSTFTGNFAENESSVIRVADSVVTPTTLDHVTIGGNDPTAESVGHDVIGPSGGGANSMVVRSSVIQDSCDQVVSGGYNVVEVGLPLVACEITPHPTDEFGAPFGLGLLDISGPTALFKPAWGVRLVDTGPAACPSVDQRGLAMPSGRACDIGAVEYQQGDIDHDSGSGSFGTFYAGGSAPITRTLTFRNVAGASPDGGMVGPAASLAITGADEDDFDVTDVDCTSGDLAPANTCAVDVTFDPAALGSKAASLTLDFSSGDVVVPLTGSVLAPPPSMVASPTTAAFGTRIIDSGATTTTTITYSNNGPLAMAGPPTAAGVAIAGADASQFELVPGTDTCTGATVPASGACTVGVRYRPTAIGAQAATLTVQFALQHLTVNLTGTGRPLLATCTDQLASVRIDATSTIDLACTGDIDSYELLDAPPTGTAKLSGRTLTYVATATDVGPFTVRFRAHNASGPSNTATLTVTRTRTQGLQGRIEVPKRMVASRALRLPCTIDAGEIERCTIVARVGNTIVARGAVVVPASKRTRSTFVVLRPTPAGLVRMARTVGGIDARFTIVVTSRDDARALSMRRARLLPARQAVAAPLMRMFVGASTTLSRDGQSHLRRLAIQLRGVPVSTVVCTGYSSVWKSVFGDLRIGMARAQVVCDELQRLGVRARFIVRSGGGLNPRASNGTEAGRELNRRVDLTFGYRAS